MTNESRVGPTNKEEGKEFRVQCPNCEAETFHRVIRSAEYVDNYEEQRYSITIWADYQIIECLGCRTVSFRQVFRNSENYDHDPDTGEVVLEERVELFPNRETGRPEIEDVEFLPVEIQRVYAETLTGLRNAMPVLVGIGIRAIVETVCKDQKAEGKNLEKRIDGLVTQGLLTRAGADILHSLRILGNAAAHEVKPHEMTDLNTAMDVIEHVLTGVYVLPRKAERLPQRTRKAEPAEPGQAQPRPSAPEDFSDQDT